MSDPAIVYNNMGARLLSIDRGSPFVALDIFQGALEVLLADMRQQVQVDRQNASEGAVSRDPALEEPEAPTPCLPRLSPVETHETIRRADAHLQAMNEYLSLDANEPQTLPHSLMTPLPGESNVVTEAIVVPVESRGYDPYINKTPFEISEESASSHGNGTIIIYNIGLVHQLVDPDSPVIPAFYQKSAALFASVPTTRENNLFRLSLLNNYGVWCAEHGDGEWMRTSMEQLSRALDEFERTEDLSMIDESIRQGFRSNIQFFLTPSNGGSPVA